DIEVRRPDQAHDGGFPAPVEGGQPDRVGYQQDGGHDQDQRDDDHRVPGAVEQPVELVQDGHLVDHGFHPEPTGDRAGHDVVVGLRVLQLDLERVGNVAVPDVLDEG